MFALPPIAGIARRQSNCPLCATSGHRDALDKIRPLRGRYICASAQCSDVDYGFLVARRRRNFSLPIGTYLHSQRSRVH